MKLFYRIIISLHILLACKATKAGITNPNTKKETKEMSAYQDTVIVDTLSYVKTNFITKKEKYINKKLEIFLNDLKIPVSSYTANPSFRDTRVCPIITLSFDDKNKTSRRIMFEAKKPVIIIVEFVTPIPMVSILLLKTENPGSWQEEEKKFYGKQIVKDIGVTNSK